jgi:hypothetical protein
MQRDPGRGGARPPLGAADPKGRHLPWPSALRESFERLHEPLGDEAGGGSVNDVRCPDGAEVLSGETPLRCERGIWVERRERHV